MKKNLTILIILLSVTIWALIWLTTFDGLQIIRYRCYQVEFCSPLSQIFESPKLVGLTSFSKVFDIFYFPRLLKKSELPVYSLKVTSKDYAKILDSLPQPFSSYFFFNDNPIKIPATFSDGKTDITAELSLRGLNPLHWSGEKKSWELKFSANQPYHEYKQLDFNVPSDSFYYGMYLKSRVSEKLGLPSEKWHFAKLVINGIDFGPYAVIEPIDQWFLERNQLANGIIFGDVDPNPDRPNLYEDLRAWKTSDPISKPEDFSPLNIILNALKQPENNELQRQVLDLIDIENFSKWEAMAVFLNSRHQDGLHNIRLYQNPANGKIEFIFNDIVPDILKWKINNDQSNTSILSVSYNPLVDYLLLIPEIRAKRDETLKNLIFDNDFTDELWAGYDKLYQQTKRDFYDNPKEIGSNLKYDYTVSQLKKSLELNAIEVKKELNAK